MTSTTLTAVVSAMPEELAPLRGRITAGKTLKAGHVDIVVGRLAGIEVALAITGDGERRAREGIASVLNLLPVQRLIVAGVAGALSPALREDTLVAAEEVVCEGQSENRDARQDGSTGKGNHRFVADETLLAIALRSTNAVRGVVVSARAIADTVAEKRRLLALVAVTQAAHAAVVDLESAVYVRAAAAAAIPWLVLRAVSDTADQALPALLNRSRDEGGAVRRGRVLRGLLGDPGALPVLLGLRRRVERCAAVLATAVETVLVAPPEARAIATQLVRTSAGDREST